MTMKRITLLACTLTVALYPTGSVAGTASLVDDTIILEDGMDKVVTLYHRYRTTLHFPCPPIQLDLGDSDNYTLKKSLDGLRATIDVKALAQPTNLNITLPGVRGTLRLKVVNSSHEARAAYRLRYPPESEIPSNRSQSQQESTADWTAKVVRARTPSRISWSGSGHTLVLKPGVLLETKNDVLMPFEVANTGDYPYPVVRLELLDHKQRIVSSADVVRHSWMGTGISDKEREIEQGQTAQFIFHVTRPSAITKGWVVRIVSSSSIRPATFEWIPSTQAKRYGVFQDRISVVFRVVGGATKLDDGTGIGIEQRAWTQLQGVGAWLSYGRGHHTSLELGVDVVRTGTAQIGATATRATGGRLYFGGRLHTGRRFVPYARGGVGIMLAQHTLEAVETATDFRASGMLFLGGGVNWVINRRSLVGLSLLGHLPIGGDQTGPALELGLQAGILLGR